MKKLVLTIAIILGITIGAFSQEKGLFGLGRSRGEVDEFSINRDTPMLGLPEEHGSTGDNPAPLGSGIAVLIGFGAAYAMSKRRKE